MMIVGLPGWMDVLVDAGERATVAGGGGPNCEGRMWKATSPGRYARREKSIHFSRVIPLDRKETVIRD